MQGTQRENSENTHAFPVFASDAGRGRSLRRPLQGNRATRSSKRLASAAATGIGTQPQIALGRVKRSERAFFAASKSAELYPDGSSEGILKPGEQYDPLGHIPESIRTKCHVIDTGAIGTADLDRVTSQYAKTGILDTSTEGVYAKGTDPGVRGKLG